MIIDMTRPRWGHNWDAKQGDDGLLRGFMWATPGPRVGDEVLWRSVHGLTRGEIVESKWTMNVDDMFSVVVEVKERGL